MLAQRPINGVRIGKVLPKIRSGEDDMNALVALALGARGASFVGH